LKKTEKMEMPEKKVFKKPEKEQEKN